MRSFVYAFRGIFDTIKSERNMRIHLCFTYYVVLAGIITHLSAAEWAAVLICIGLVTALECLNTALESLCDTVHPERAEGIRKAKDAAAGAVLCAAIASAAAGAFIFFRADKIGAALQFCRDNAVIALLFAMILPGGIVLIAGRRKGKEKG